MLKNSIFKSAHGTNYSIPCLCVTCRMFLENYRTEGINYIMLSLGAGLLSKLHAIDILLRRLTDVQSLDV